MQTTTISDYTMQYRIPEKVFTDFKDKVYQEKLNPFRKTNSAGTGPIMQKTKNSANASEIENNESLVYAFKVYLKNEFEAVLRDTEHIKSKNDSLIKISHIHLGFDHIKLHNMLQTRGDALKSKKVEKKEKIEKEIVEYIHKNKEYLSTPKDAYIIFETEECFHRAMKFNSIKKCGKELATRQWKGTNLILENVKEPTNIAFENKYKSKLVFIIKTITVALILMFALGLTCYLIFFFQVRVNKLNRQYPEVNCDAVVADSSPEMLKDYAMLEFYNYDTSDKSDETILMLNTDNMQCYCDDISNEDGYFTALNREFDVTVLDHHITGQVCNDYLQSAIFIQLTAVILPLMIIVFNVVLKMLAIILVNWLGIENKTVNISIIQSVVFILMFFNSAIAILLINSNVEGANQNGLFFNGLYSDFSDDWFDKISMFFLTPMFAQIIFPITYFVPGYIIQKGLAMLDRNFTDPKLYKTKCNLAYDYAEANSGTEHLLYEKYPRLLNIIFVSLFYGFGMPLLPILIFISLVISYFFDKIAVALYHRKPPLYDDTLNVVSIHFLKWAAFLYIAVAYWMLTNKQLFGNDLKPIAYQAQIEYFDHHIFEWPDTPQESVVLIVALLILLYCLINLVFHLIEPLFESTSDEELMEFEDLESFPKALNQRSLTFWVTEEKQIREKYGYKYLFDDFYQKISMRFNSANERKSFKYQAPPKRFITDATNYDYLYLKEYAHSYAYIPVTKRRGQAIDNDSNFTRRALDFPYHQEDEIAYYDQETQVQEGGDEEKNNTTLFRGITSVVV